MAAENNVIKKAQIAKVREVDFSLLFTENVKNLIKMLGVTRKIAVQAGTTLKVLKVTGTLESGIVAEGDIIPLSKYETTWTPVAEATLNKWRKATTAEAMLKGGYDQSVNDTNKKMLLDIQKGIRTQFVTSLATGTGTATGTGLQAALANAWGKLQVLFEDDAVEAVYFVNPMDVSDYIGSAQITVQTAFGMNYVENFLGLGTVIMTGAIEKGSFYATAKENIVCYYINVNEANGIGEAFDFTTDPETGFVGIHEDGNYTRMQEETVAISGITFFAERPDGVLVGTIGNFNDTLVVKAEPAGGKLFDVDVNDMQSDVSFGNGKVTLHLSTCQVQMLLLTFGVRVISFVSTWQIAHGQVIQVLRLVLHPALAAALLRLSTILTRTVLLRLVTKTSSCLQSFLQMAHRHAQRLIALRILCLKRQARVKTWN